MRCAGLQHPRVAAGPCGDTGTLRAGGAHRGVWDAGRVPFLGERLDGEEADTCSSALQPLQSGQDAMRVPGRSSHHLRLALWESPGCEHSRLRKESLSISLQFSRASEVGVYGCNAVHLHAIVLPYT